MAPFDGRSASDLVLLALAFALSVSLVLLVAGLLVLSAVRPDVDLTPSLNQLGSGLAALAGSLLGFVAGRHSSTSLE